MILGRKLDFWVGMTVACAAAIGGANVKADPLVTGDLLIYYDFDSFTDVVMDGSGNGFNGKVQDSTRKTLDAGFELITEGVISNDTSNPRRGAGAIRFTQSTVPGDDPVFVDMDGSVIVATAPAKIPTTAVTYAAWVNLTILDSDTSIFQGASSGHGNPHFQIQGDGTIRVAMRSEGGVNTIARSDDSASTGHPYPNQPDIDANGATPIPFPINEWHHVALTYDAAAAGGAGDFDMYYDGVNIRTSPTQVADVFGEWALRSFADFYDGLGLGAVYDSGSRRLNGLMDEAYIFTRALSAAEIGTLYNLDAGLDGDYNEDGTVNAADYAVWRDGGSPDDTIAGYNLWKANFGNSGSGSGAAVPEPSTIGLLLIGMGILVARRRK